MKYVEIFSDGACAGNPGPGGWGALLQYGENAKKICGGQAQTTNNQMELTAALEALKALKQPCNVIVYTDSAYLKDGITKWLPGWKANGWKRGKKPLKNSELWQKLDEHSAIHNITWKWVRGHAGNPGNEMADKLANEGMAPFKAAFLSANK